MAAPFAQAQASDQGQVAAVPFGLASARYEEAPFAQFTQTLDANSHEFEASPPPGNYLAGVKVMVSSTGGGLGTATLLPDAPYSVIDSLELDDIGGGPILYPMSGFAYAMAQKWLRPWSGDTGKRAGFSASINPAFTLRAMVEVRDTLAVLANTDARAQYRVRLRVAPLAKLVSGSPTTPPTVTITLAAVYWAQPDAIDLLGNPIEPTPPGLVASRYLQHELIPLAAGNNTVRLSLVGNEIRGLVLIVRDSTGARKDLTDAGAGPIRHRLDQRVIWTRLPSQLVEEMAAFYPLLGNGVWSRETGVYVIPRFKWDANGGGNDPWLQTVEQNLLQLEFSGGDLSPNTPGQLEVIYDQIAIAGGVQLPGDLEAI